MVIIPFVKNYTQIQFYFSTMTITKKPFKIPFGIMIQNMKLNTLLQINLNT